MIALVRLAPALLLAASLAAPLAAQRPPGAPAPEAKVAQGRLSGTLTEDGRVRRFAGIPFAAPPTGPNRWRSPQPGSKWSGVRSAAAFGQRCTQAPLFADMVFRSPGNGEDCLFLNIWAPADISVAKRPVLVYFYGGGFVAGSGDEPRYDGESMARRGIVSVTVNYRLGAFGFLSDPAHGMAGNFGLLDQAAALDWVRANIAAFGGDPAQVTIGGESAGSMSVSALMASPLARGRFARAIGESGALMAPTFRVADRSTADASAAALFAKLGTNESAALRALPTERILAAAADLRFPPVVDGTFLTDEPTATFAAGRQARVPLLVGSNSQEQAAGSIIGQASPTIANYRAGLATQFGPNASAVEALYPAATDADVVPAATELASDRWLAFPTWKWFDLQRTAGVPVWYYRYARPRPLTLGAPAGTVPAAGAVHSAEIEYALGNLHTRDSYAWTPEDERVSATMQGYWANFVLTGDPNGPGLPRWTPAGRAEPLTRQQIDVVTESRPFTDQARYRALEPLLMKR